MSEANLPSPDQSQDPNLSSSSNLNSPNLGIPANADRQANVADGRADAQAEDWQDWQTVNFPNAISIDAIERQSLYSTDEVPPLDWLSQATPNPSAANLWSTGAGSSEPPEIADLIALIQELNQCNDVLLDRVSQLEESLERSQKTQQEDQREDRQKESVQAQPSGADLVNQKLAAAQAEITQLANDLEFSQQTTQRQQILVETLTGQLEGSQERVAQLERECALTQQRYGEQSHQLVQAENTCRDLRIRLQRQQRYTLQFKAALEKCLEVPPPHYEAKPEQAVGAVIAELQDEQSFKSQSFLPKAKRIQPWSAQPQFLSEFDSELNVGELNVGELSVSELNVRDAFENLDEAQLIPQPQAETAQGQDGIGQFRPSSPATLDLPAIVASIVPNQAAADATIADASVTVTPENSQVNLRRSTLSYDLKKSTGWWTEAASQPQAERQEQEITSTTQPEKTQSESEITASPNAEVAPAQPDLPVSKSPEAAVTEEPVTPKAGEAEDALWQDLARLIDVSADDVVKVSLSSDFDSFEAIAQPAQPTQSTQPTQPVQSQDNLPDDTRLKPQQPLLDIKQQIAQGVSIAQLLLSSTSSTEQPEATHSTAQPSSEAEKDTEQKLPSAFTANSNWPSPIVYPLRTPKKIESLAAVKLPTFPR